MYKYNNVDVYITPVNIKNGTKKCIFLYVKPSVITFKFHSVYGCGRGIVTIWNYECCLSCVCYIFEVFVHIKYITIQVEDHCRPCLCIDHV